MNPDQLLNLIITPTLKHLGLYSDAAAELVLGTAIQESHLKYLKQLGGGPALGIYQMEPDTHDDIWLTYLHYRPYLADKVKELELPQFVSGADEMVGNLYYATAMCRIHYRRRKEPLPVAGDLSGQAAYWKRFYNTSLGKGTMTDYIHNWGRYR